MLALGNSEKCSCCIQTQTSLVPRRLSCGRKVRREGDYGRRLPSVPFPWSLTADHHLAKNEAPEEEAEPRHRSR